jgi:hypothetical protein
MFLPQYNPYQRDDDVAGWLAMATLLWAMLVLLGLFLLSAWLTQLFLQHVVNPYLKGALDRNDGLVVAWSSLLWAVAAILLALPGLLSGLAVASAQEVGAAFLGVTGTGIAWGAAIGAFLVVKLWLEVEEVWEPTPGFAQVTQLPPQHYASLADDKVAEPLSVDEVEALVKHTAWQEAEEMVTVPVEAAETTPPPNEREPVPMGER